MSKTRFRKIVRRVDREVPAQPAKRSGPAVDPLNAVHDDFWLCGKRITPKPRAS